jgi:hypothetical protein
MDKNIPAHGRSQNHAILGVLEILFFRKMADNKFDGTAWVNSLSESEVLPEFEKLMLWILTHKEISLAKKKESLSLILKHCQNPTAEIKAAIRVLESILESSLVQRVEL